MKKVLLIVSVLAAVAMAVLDLSYDDGIRPDEVYQMANQHIVWEYAEK
mgnify:CR=1 FL=1